MKHIVFQAIFIGGLFFWFMLGCGLIVAGIMVIATREGNNGLEGTDETSGAFDQEEFSRNLDRAWRDWNDNNRISGE